MSAHSASPFEGEYTQYPPDDVTPNWDEYTVSFDDVEIPTFQISIIDAQMAIEVDVASISVYTPLQTCAEMEIETPEETFLGELDHIQIEEGGLTLWVERTACSA